MDGSGQSLLCRLLALFFQLVEIRANNVFHLRRNIAAIHGTTRRVAVCWIGLTVWHLRTVGDAGAGRVAGHTWRLTTLSRLALNIRWIIWVARLPRLIHQAFVIAGARERAIITSTVHIAGAVAITLTQVRRI